MPPSVRPDEAAAESDAIAEWLGVDPAIMSALPPAVIGTLSRRLDEWRQAGLTVEAYGEVSAAAHDRFRSLHERARLDGLTGILNRRGIEEHLDRELRRAVRGESPLAVLVLDVDGLKATNDRLGHVAGDDLLRAAAGHIQRELRPTDLVGRIGGDEFLCVLPGADEAQARDIATRIFTSAGDPDADSRPPRLSIGWASTSEGIWEAPRLIADADRRLYRDRGRRAAAARRAPPAGEPQLEHVVRTVHTVAQANKVARRARVAVTDSAKLIRRHRTSDREAAQ